MWINKNGLILLALGLVLNSCTPQLKDVSQTVTVSVLPQKFFVNQIAGNWLNVNVMVPPGSSPSTYEPTPIQMKDLSHSQVYFKIGHIGFEKAWMDKLTAVNLKMKVVDTSTGMNLIEEEEFGEVHDDGHGHSHIHEGFNPHTWLSPNQVRHQSNIIFNELALAYPEKADEMKLNLENFLLKIDSAQQDLDLKLGGKQGVSFIVYHPVWTYLAYDYGLKQVSIEFNGKEATPRKLKEIVDFAKENEIHTIFVQKEFSTAQAQSIADEINGSVIQLNPLAYDWFAILDEFGKAFASIDK